MVTEKTTTINRSTQEQDQQSTTNQKATGNFNPPNSNRGVKPEAQAYPDASQQKQKVSRPVVAEAEHSGNLDVNSSLKTGVKLDWLAITINPSEWPESQPLYPDGLAKEWTEATPGRGYNVARQFVDGRKESHHTSRPDMGIHIVYSGRTLNEIELERNVSGLDILRFYQERGSKITRLDIALDAYDSGINLTKLAKHFDAGEAETHVKKGVFMAGLGQGSGTTLYIGSRKSEAYARYYDKAAEQGYEGDHKRFELELKKTKAVQVAAILVASDDPDRDIRAIIRGHCDFSAYDSIWATIMTIPSQVITRAKVTEKQTKQWLIGICAPAFVKFCTKNQDEKTYYAFFDEIDGLMSNFIAGGAWATCEKFTPELETWYSG